MRWPVRLGVSAALRPGNHGAGQHRGQLSVGAAGFFFRPLAA